MKFLIKQTVTAVFCFSAFLLSQVHAENGVTENQILLGQSGNFSGGYNSATYRHGALLYFDYINRNGGVHGRKIKMLLADDENKPEKVIVTTRKFLNEDKVFLLFGYMSTPVVKAAIPLAVEQKTPFFAPYTGAEEFYANHSRYVFTTRASFGDELEHIVRFLSSTGLTRIAMASYDNKTGDELIENFKTRLAERKLKLLGVGKMKIYSKDAVAAVKSLKALNAEAILLGPTALDAAALIREMDKEGVPRPFYFGRSLINAQQLKDNLGPLAQGVAITQTAPNPYKAIAIVAKEYKKLLQENDPQKEPEYLGLEGFIAAKTLVEGIRRTGPKLSREKLIDALDAMNDYDMGGYLIRFNKNKHHGAHYVDLTYIGKGGRIFD